MLDLLFHVGKGVANQGVFNIAKALADPTYALAGDLISKIAFDAWASIRAEKKRDKLYADILATAKMDFAEIRRQAAEIAAKVAPNDKTLRGHVERFVTLVPAAVNASLRRVDDPSGATLPRGFALEDESDLVKLLPVRFPRDHFKPGYAPPYLRGWELVLQLGAGGFGEVWKVCNSETPNLVGAVKISHELNEAELSLLNEGDVLNRLLAHGQHPGIVAIQDNSLRRPKGHPAAEPHLPWIRYEYVSGGDLTALILRWASLPMEQRVPKVLAAFREICETVAYFHRLTPSPIVHRDLKPSNILVTADGRLKISDFGIGSVSANRILDSGRLGTLSQTNTVQAYLRGALTPLYAPPEQRTELKHRHVPTDDVHALGVILYQLLTGQLKNAPGVRFDRELGFIQVPQPLIEILGDCVETDKSKRPADAAAILHKLNREPTLPKPIPGIPPIPKPVPDLKPVTVPRPVVSTPPVSTPAAVQVAVATQSHPDRSHNIRLIATILLALLIAGSIAGWICTGNPWRTLAYAGGTVVVAAIWFVISALVSSLIDKSQSSLAGWTTLLALFILTIIYIVHVTHSLKLFLSGVRGDSHIEIALLITGGVFVVAYYTYKYLWIGVLTFIVSNGISGWQFGTFEGDSSLVVETQPWNRKEPLTELRLAPDATPVTVTYSRAVVELSPDGTRRLDYVRDAGIGDTPLRVKDRVSGNVLYDLGRTPSAAFFLTNSTLLLHDQSSKEVSIYDLESATTLTKTTLYYESVLSNPIPTGATGWTVIAFGTLPDRKTYEKSGETLHPQFSVMKLELTPKCIRMLTSAVVENSRPATSLRFSPDQNYLLGVSLPKDNSIVDIPQTSVYRVTDYAAMLSTGTWNPGHPEITTTTCVAKPPGDRTLLLGHQNGNISAYNMDSKTITRTYSGHTAAVTAIELTADGTEFISISRDTTIRHWKR